MEIPQQFKNPFESVKDVDVKIENLKKKLKEYEEENSSFIKKYAAELEKRVMTVLPAVTCWEAPDTFYKDGDGKYWYHLFFWLWGKRFRIGVEESKFQVGIETDGVYQVRYRDTSDLTNIGEIVLDLFNEAANYEE